MRLTSKIRALARASAATWAADAKIVRVGDAVCVVGIDLESAGRRWAAREILDCDRETVWWGRCVYDVRRRRDAIHCVTYVGDPVQ